MIQSGPPQCHYRHVNASSARRKPGRKQNHVHFTSISCPITTIITSLRISSTFTEAGSPDYVLPRNHSAAPTQCSLKSNQLWCSSYSPGPASYPTQRKKSHQGFQADSNWVSIQDAIRHLTFGRKLRRAICGNFTERSFGHSDT